MSTHQKWNGVLRASFSFVEDGIAERILRWRFSESRRVADYTSSNLELVLLSASCVSLTMQ